MATKRLKELLFLRKNKIILGTGNGNPAPGVIGSLLAELSAVGFTLSAELVENLGTYTTDSVGTWYKDTLKPMVETAIGHRIYTPMYPNFPRQVMEASQEELFLNAFIHYFGVGVLGLNILPDYQKQPRDKFAEKLPKLKVISLGNDDDFADLFIDVLGMNTSPSVAELKVLEALPDLNANLVVNIRNKEILAIVSAAILKQPIQYDQHKHLLDQLDTATDVLRVLSVYSALPESAALVGNVRFKSFPRRIRRWALGVLNDKSSNQLIEDMMRYRQKWVRLGERLHPGEYTQFGNVNDAFKAIRNSAVGLTINSAVELNKKERNWRQVADLLSKRPGTFARSLDEIFRKAPTKDHNYILHKFSNVAADVGTNVLWQAYGHFLKNYRDYTQYYYPKGATSKAKPIDKTIPALSPSLYDDIRVIIRNALQASYKTRENPFGNAKEIYIDPLCWSLKIPSFTRTISDTAGRVVGRGSRFSGGNKDVIRLFAWWLNIDPSKGDNYNNRVDLDLTAVLFDDNLDFLAQCSWTNLRSGSNRGGYAFVHSGDITDAPRPNGGSEFLDVYKSGIHAQYPKARYVIPYIVNFTGQPIKNVENLMGWMDRDSAQAGEIYEPRTVNTSFSSTAESTMVVPFIYDVQSNEIIWVDLDVGGHGAGRYANEDTYVKLGTLCKAIQARSTAFIGDVFLSFAEAHGLVLVDQPTANSFNVTEDGDVSPYDMAKFFNVFN